MHKKEKKNMVYMVECADHTLYTGWTNDIENRMKTHNSGKGAKYTRSRLPVRLVYLESFETKEEAMSREFFIKELRRTEKEKLIISASNELPSYDFPDVF